MTPVPKPAPHLQVSSSLWESYSFTPRRASKETIRITHEALGNYLLSYINNDVLDHRRKLVRVVPQSNTWKLEFLLPTGMPEQLIEDRSHFLSLSQVPKQLKIAEAFAVLGILFSTACAGYEIHHRRYFPRAVPLIGCGLLLIVCLIFSRNVFRRRYAFENALRLITVVEHAARNNTSIDERTLAYSPYADYQR